MRGLGVVLVLFAAFSLFSLGAEERHRTTLHDASDELTGLWAQIAQADAVEADQLLLALVRQGGEALIALPDSDGTRFVNARDAALTQLLRKPREKNERATRSLMRAGEDPDRLEKVLERFPSSHEALTALEKLLTLPGSAGVRSRWRALIPHLKTPPAHLESFDIHLPASEIHCEQIDFPSRVSGDVVLRGSVFAPRRAIPGYPESPDYPRFPQSSLVFCEGGLLLADYRGLIRLGLSNRFQPWFYETDSALLKHLDNNIIADVTRIGSRYLSSQRHTPQKRDMQKNLYIVDLSRQAITCFREDHHLEEHPRYEETWSWSPEWILASDETTYNGSLVARGETAFLTATTPAGLFNVEIAALDAVRGKFLWRRPLVSGQHELNYFGRHVREALAGTPLVTQERLYVSSNFGTVHAFDIAGRPLWATRYSRVSNPIPVQYYAMVPPRLSAFRNQMPRRIDGRLYCAPTDSDSLLCFDAETGEALWQRSLNPDLSGDRYPHNDFWRKAFWYVSSEGVWLWNQGVFLRLDPVTGKEIANHPLGRSHLLYLGRPLVFRNAFVFAAAGFLTVVDKKTLKIRARHDLTPLGLRFAEAQIFWDQGHLVILDTEGNIQILRLEETS